MAETKLLLSRSLQPGGRGKYQLEKLIPMWSEQEGEKQRLKLEGNTETELGGFCA